MATMPVHHYSVLCYSNGHNSHFVQFIPKGLTIGYDNWADMTPEGMARNSMKYNKEVYTEMFAELGEPDLTDDELNARVKTYYEEFLSCTPVVVKAVCVFLLTPLYTFTGNIYLGSSQSR
jgi:hypothetical protein